MKPLLLIPVFLFSIATVLAQPYVNQDCVGAVSLCYGRYELPYSFAGAGQVEELDGRFDNDPNFCLLNGENNSAWYKLQFSSSGELIFEIDPYSSYDDYDFAVFSLKDFTPAGTLIYNFTCNDLADAAPSLRCNYAVTHGVTGLAFGQTSITAEPNGDSLLAPIAVDSGDVLYLVVDNFTRNGEGFSLDFTGTTATMISDDSFYVSSGYTTVLPDTIKVDMFFNHMFYCQTLSPDFSEFVLLDNSGDTLEILSVDCDSLANHITVSAAYGANQVDSVTVHYQDGFDGNIILSQCGSVEMGGTPKTFENRNGPGKLDFTHTQSGHTFQFTPIAHHTADLEWYVNDTFRSTNNSIYNSDFSLFQPYEVCLVAGYGYTTDTVCKNYYLTGLEHISATDAFQLYPNPASGEITISLPFGAESIEITDINGRVVERLGAISPTQKTTFNAAHLSQGLYLVRVAHPHGTATQKLQILHL